MNIFEKLLCIQIELKAPKNQYNSFGKYNYRNCEDILEAVKPICKKYGAVLVLRDKPFVVNERYYVETTATLYDCEKPEDHIFVTASAREEETKKGMDGSQVTGASSSYARKYALNGLFDIDDTKDSDTTNKGGESQGKGDEKDNPNPLTREELKELGVTDFKTFGEWVKKNYKKAVLLLTEGECDEIRDYLAVQKEKREKKVQKEAQAAYDKAVQDGDDIPF